MKKLALILVALSTLAHAEYGGGSSGVGSGNPASVNCINLGGKLVMGDTEQGQIGICQLGSVEVEEWTLFRTVQGECTTAARKLLTQGKIVLPKPEPGMIGMPNPASVNCINRGGKEEGVEVKEGADTFCKFSDNSLIGEWSLARGRNAQGAQQFARIAYRACSR